MPITTIAPYTSGNTVTSVMRRFRDKGLSVPIDGGVLLRAGVSESLVKRTLQALQLLDLIDDAGNPTATFQKLRTAPEADYKARLQEWLQSAYAEVFQYVDPKVDDGSRIRDAFRTYLPHGQQDRMVALFLALCAEADLAPETKKSESKPAARKPVTRAVAGSAAAAIVNTRGNRAAAPAVLARQHNAHTGLHPALVGLIQGIPAAEQGWTQAERDKFYATFGTLLDFAVPIVTQAERNRQDEAE